MTRVPAFAIGVSAFAGGALAVALGSPSIWGAILAGVSFPIGVIVGARIARVLVAQLVLTFAIASVVALGVAQALPERGAPPVVAGVTTIAPPRPIILPSSTTVAATDDAAPAPPPSVSPAAMDSGACVTSPGNTSQALARAIDPRDGVSATLCAPDGAQYFYFDVTEDPGRVDVSVHVERGDPYKVAVWLTTNSFANPTFDGRMNQSSGGGGAYLIGWAPETDPGMHMQTDSFALDPGRYYLRVANAESMTYHVGVTAIARGKLALYAIPRDLRAEYAGANAIQLRWSTMRGATYYLVYDAPSSKQLARVAAPEYLVQGIDEHVDHEYAVFAGNDVERAPQPALAKLAAHPP